MTKPPGVLIWFSVTLHLVRGVREMGKHTLISLSAKWYVFLGNPYMEGEGLCLPTFWRFFGSWECCGLTLSIVSKGRTFPTWLLTLARNSFSAVINQSAMEHHLSMMKVSQQIDLILTDSMTVEQSFQTQDPHLKILTLKLNSVEWQYSSPALLRPTANLWSNKVTT